MLFKQKYLPQNCLIKIICKLFFKNFLLHFIIHIFKLKQKDEDLKGNGSSTLVKVSACICNNLYKHLIFVWAPLQNPRANEKPKT